MRILSLGAALLCLAFPFAPLAGQDHGRSHGRLGVVLDGRTQGEDTLGVRVRDVVPDSPADDAGLRRGDVITRFNGTALGGARKLVELARALEPGDTVRLEYRRDSETKTATLVADRMAPRLVTMFHRMPHSGAGMEDMAPGMSFFRHRSSGLQLVEMSRDLGEYFGTSEGLLVVKAPADSASPLKAGDVLLAIDGRKPRSVAHAFDILGSYAAGEKAKLEVLRKRQRVTLNWTAPERHRGPEWRRGVERGEGPESADLFELEPLPPALGLGET